MSKFIGRRLAVGIGKETARGTGVAPTYWLSATAFKFFDKAIKARSEAGTGGIWGGDISLTARKYSEGDVEFELDSKSFPLILLATFGSLSTGSFSGAYKHTFTIQNDAQCDTLSFHTSDPNGSYIYEFGMINNLKMEFTPVDLVKCTIGVKAQSSGTTINTPAYISTTKFLGRQLAVKVADLTANLTAATKLTISKASIEINKNVEFYNVVGSVQPQDIYNKLFEIKGELEISFDDMTYRDYMLNGTYRAMRLDLINTDATVGTTNPSFRIDLSRVDFDAWDVDYAMNDLVKQKVQFTALYDATNSNVINDCYVVNDVTTY